MTFLNIAAYKFIALNELPALRTALKTHAQENHLRGTILISTEGINLMLVGLPSHLNHFKNYLHKIPEFSDLYYKESFSQEQTFNRLLVKIKKEIIAFGVESIDPIHEKAPYVKPAELKQWLDEKKEVYLIDARNDYEVRLGTFSNAQALNIHHFRDFPEAVKKIDGALKQKTVVTFCTGGIRCEKAALLLQQEGFENIYQLEGGILDYFKECGQAHYEGECFVFDRRVGIDANLEETGTLQCFACLAPISLEEQQHPAYVPDKVCPHCVTAD
jgi:UPF0176 protein